MASMASIPSVGDLFENISVVRLVTTQDEMGGEGNEQWLPAEGMTSLRARITPVTGTERALAQGLQAFATWTIVVRSSSITKGITEADKIVNNRNGKVYQVKSIQNYDERNRFIWLNCQSGSLV